MTMRNVSIISFFIGAMLLFAYSVHAQFGLPGIENAIFIEFSPRYPAPGETVRLTVKSALFDIAGSDLKWEARGKTIAEGKGVDSAEVVAGALGTETAVEVTLISADLTTASARATIAPTELHLLVDSDSYLPPFYKGGARASAGTRLLLQAVPHFRLGSTFVPASDLMYTWRRNEEVLGNISGRGKSTVIIPAPHLFGTDKVSVEVRTDDGLLSREASVSLSSSEPVLTLYEDHPLFGTLYHRALGPSASIPESEMTFAAVPLFAQARSAVDGALNFSWKVNGASVSSNPSAPHKLTINADNSTGVALVGLEVTHATNYYLDARGFWNITFSVDASGLGQFGNFIQ